MRSLHVTATTQIHAPADVVRRQFADVAHHAVTGLHRGVRFEVIDDDGRTCRYRQISRVGPLRLRQELHLERTAAGPLVNTVTAGQFAGGTITFDIAGATNQITGQPVTGQHVAGHHVTGQHVAGHQVTVTATLAADVGGLTQFAAPILRRTVRRALIRALEEDRVDLESGHYDQVSTAA